MALPERYVAIERKLDGTLADFVGSRRDSGMSWRRIANEILLTTGEDISHEALRIWFQGRAPVVGVTR